MFFWKTIKPARGEAYLGRAAKVRGEVLEIGPRCLLTPEYWVKYETAREGIILLCRIAAAGVVLLAMGLLIRRIVRRRIKGGWSTRPGLIAGSVCAAASLLITWNLRNTLGWNWDGHQTLDVFIRSEWLKEITKAALIGLSAAMLYTARHYFKYLRMPRRLNNATSPTLSSAALIIGLAGMLTGLGGLNDYLTEALNLPQHSFSVVWLTHFSGAAAGWGEVLDALLIGILGGGAALLLGEALAGLKSKWTRGALVAGGAIIFAVVYQFQNGNPTGAELAFYSIKILMVVLLIWLLFERPIMNSGWEFPAALFAALGLERALALLNADGSAYQTSGWTALGLALTPILAAAVKDLFINRRLSSLPENLK